MEREKHPGLIEARDFAKKYKTNPNVIARAATKVGVSFFVPSELVDNEDFNNEVTRIIEAHSVGPRKLQASLTPEERSASSRHALSKRYRGKNIQD